MLLFSLRIACDRSAVEKKRLVRSLMVKIKKNTNAKKTIEYARVSLELRGTIAPVGHARTRVRCNAYASRGHWPSRAICVKILCCDYTELESDESEAESHADRGYREAERKINLISSSPRRSNTRRVSLELIVFTFLLLLFFRTSKLCFLVSARSTVSIFLNEPISLSLATRHCRTRLLHSLNVKTNEMLFLAGVW